MLALLIRATQRLQTCQRLQSRSQPCPSASNQLSCTDGSHPNDPSPGERKGLLLAFCNLTKRPAHPRLAPSLQWLYSSFASHSHADQKAAPAPCHFSCGMHSSMHQKASIAGHLHSCFSALEPGPVDKHHAWRFVAAPANSLVK